MREKYIRITRVCVATVDEDGIYGMPFLLFLSFLPSLSINYNYRGCGIISRFRSTFANFNFVDVQSMVVYGMENNNSFLRSYFVIRVRIIFNFCLLLKGVEGEEDSQSVTIFLNSFFPLENTSGLKRRKRRESVEDFLQFLFQDNYI